MADHANTAAGRARARRCARKRNADEHQQQLQQQDEEETEDQLEVEQREHQQHEDELQQEVGQPQQPQEEDSGAAASVPSRRAAKQMRLPGFSMPPSIKVWRDPMAPVVLADYLRLQKLTLKLAQSPPVEEWTCNTKPAITCNHCGVNNSTSASISNLQRGQGISCLCNPGHNSLTQRWYYERAIARPFEDRNKRLWYAKLHDGSLAKPSWEEWRAVAEHGAIEGKLRLTCLHCGITSNTTSIHSLQRGHGIACQCAKKRA
jgi:hypothetical protein